MRFELGLKIALFMFFFNCISAFSQEYRGITLNGDTVTLSEKFVLIVVNEFNCKGCMSTLNEIRSGMRGKKNWYVFINLQSDDVQSATSRAMRLFDTVSVPKDHFVYKILSEKSNSLAFCEEDYSPFLMVKGNRGLKRMCYTEIFNDGLSISELRAKVKALLN